MEFLGISERKKRALLHEEALREKEKILDVFQCIERLSELDAMSLRKLVQKERMLAVPRLEKLLAFKVDIVELLTRLPLQLIACVLAQEPRVDGDWPGSVTTHPLYSITWHGHIVKGLRLLITLCTLSEALSPLASLVGGADFQQRLLDLVVLILLSAAGPDVADNLASAAEDNRIEEAMERAATVPTALRALTIGLLPVSANIHMQQKHWHSLSRIVLLQPRSIIFVDAVFDAIRTIYRMVRVAMEKGCSNVPGLAFQAGLSMEWLTELCCTPLFYYRLALHDPSLAGPLRLISAGLNLHSPPFTVPPYSASPDGSPNWVEQAYSTAAGEGTVELLVARSLALMTSLTEYEETSFLDQTVAQEGTRELAIDVAARASQLAGVVMQRPMSTQWPVRSPGEGQLAVAALQVLEVLADDSNFRRMAMRAVAASAAIMLTTPPADFESAWCAGEEARALHKSDFAIDGRSIMIGPMAPQYVKRLEALASLLKRDDLGNLSSATRAKIAHVELEAALRALSVFEILGNLHCYNKDTCTPDMHNLFAKLLSAELQHCGPSAAGTRRENGRAAVKLALTNLRRLHIYAVGVSEDADSKDMDIVAADDIDLLQSLSDALMSINGVEADEIL
ncbi:g11044 [Coccomyxa elongata]